MPTSNTPLSKNPPLWSASVALAGVGLCLFVFQNCAGYAPESLDATSASSSATTALPATCPPAGCPSNREAMILKAGGNANPLHVASNQAAIDVGGDCSNGGYATGIFWHVLSTAASGQTVGCDELGRWRAHVSLPSGIARGGAAYALEINLVGQDPDTGKLFVNPLTLNKQTVNLILE